MKTEILTFFIGSYTEYPVPGFGGTGRGIYTVELNIETGELKTLHSAFVRNPSYLAISEDNRILYCITELDEKDHPKVKAYRIKDDFSLEFLNEQRIKGGFPCHLAITGSNVLVACYMTGNVLQFPLDHTGALLPHAKNIQHQGSSINLKRQEAPHAHQVAIHPNHEDIYVCDLGIDTIKAYQIRHDELIPNEAKDCKVTVGGGPRHLVFDNDGRFAYLINELTGDVSVLIKRKGVLGEMGIYPALPEGYQGEAGGSAIRLHPNGRFLYVANRQLGAITVFNVQADHLTVIDYQYTGGEEIREFHITPDGQWLIACHQNSHDTVVYNIEENGKLTERYRTKEILSPVCIVFPN